MTEENQTAQDNREFGIQKIYTKDISLETPNSPDIFREEWKPEINLQLGNTAKALSDGVNEVVLTVTVTAKVGRKTAYLVEIQQAGIFNIKGYTEEEMGFMAGSFCPNILFPYARETISGLVTHSGFPPLILQPVNFEALYQQHMQQQQTKTKEGQQSIQTTH